eukprot:NODE_9972_length_550_cov_21.477752_g9329_i0.p1 GENE.NODE_9972_length_550_cov_21.477752_g9329_i0~~NODE_9972_length_550_cov_21.477752_g9329_i0.p1  ORF type:complete len:105 (+),score=15.33 NODE_9972_length_550_cov_21.477752_g9329_i0:67-381(+)
MDPYSTEHVLRYRNEFDSLDNEGKGVVSTIKIAQLLQDRGKARSVEEALLKIGPIASSENLPFPLFMMIMMSNKVEPLASINTTARRTSAEISQVGQEMVKSTS